MSFNSLKLGLLLGLIPNHFLKDCSCQHYKCDCHHHRLLHFHFLIVYKCFGFSFTLFLLIIRPSILISNFSNSYLFYFVYNSVSYSFFSIRRILFRCFVTSLSIINMSFMYMILSRFNSFFNI